MTRKPVTPGKYPTTYRCIVCGHERSKKEVLSGQAELLEDTACVCAGCKDAWNNDKYAPIQELITRKPARTSLISKFRRQWRRKQKQERILDTLATFLDASMDDPSMRGQLLAIAQLDDHQREMMLDPIIARLQLERAPDELLQLLVALKDPEIARCALNILTGN